VNLLSDMKKRLTKNRASDWPYVNPILTLPPFINRFSVEIINAFCWLWMTLDL
jgi:hypothetical protein